MGTKYCAPTKKTERLAQGLFNPERSRGTAPGKSIYMDLTMTSPAFNFYLCKWGRKPHRKEKMNSLHRLLTGLWVISVGLFLFSWLLMSLDKSGAALLRFIFRTPETLNLGPELLAEFAVWLIPLLICIFLARKYIRWAKKTFQTMKIQKSLENDANNPKGANY